MTAERRSVERSILAFFKFGEADSRNFWVLVSSLPKPSFASSKVFLFLGALGSLPLGALLFWGPFFSSGGVGLSNEIQSLLSMLTHAPYKLSLSFDLRCWRYLLFEHKNNSNASNRPLASRSRKMGVKQIIQALANVHCSKIETEELSLGPSWRGFFAGSAVDEGIVRRRHLFWKCFQSQRCETTLRAGFNWRSPIEDQPIVGGRVLSDGYGSISIDCSLEREHKNQLKLLFAIQLIYM